MNDIERTNSQAIFEYLADIGVARVFLVPGGGNMFLVDAVGRQDKIEVVATHHEQAAVIAAEYYSRETGHIGVALVTTGPGSSNAITGVAGAWFDSIPLLIVAGQVKRDDYNHNASLRQKGPQEISMVSMSGSITKFSKTCLDPENVLEDFSEAVQAATSGRPGPVVLEIPLDVQSMPTSNVVPLKERSGHTDITKVSKIEPDVDLVASKLSSATRPVILLGHGVKCSRQESVVRRLIEDYSFPASLTWPMADFLPYDHPLNAGRIGVVAKRYSNLIIQKADVILVLGSRLDNIVTAYNSEKFGRNAEIFAVDVDQSELQKLPSKYHCINSDLADFIPILNNRLSAQTSKRTFTDWLTHISQLRAEYGREELNLIAQDATAISVYEVVDSLSEIFEGGETIVTGSSGLAVEVFHTHFRNKKDQKLSLTTGLGAMGYGLPALLGVLAAGAKKAYLFESDGSMMMNIQELQSIKTLGVNATIFIMNNNGYASIRSTQTNYFQGRYVGTGPASGLEIPDIRKVADCFGFNYLCATSKGDLNDVLTRAVKAEEPTICEVVLREDEVLFPKCSVVRTNDNKFLSAPLEDMSPLLPIETLQDTMGEQIDPVSLELRK